MDQPTFKKTVIRALTYLPSIDALKGNKLIFVTPIGLITGTFADPDEDDTTGTSLLGGFLEAVHDDFVKEDISIHGNDGCIQLEQVRIFSRGTPPQDLSDLILFYDQIIGVTIGAFGDT